MDSTQWLYRWWWAIPFVKVITIEFPQHLGPSVATPAIPTRPAAPAARDLVKAVPSLPKTSENLYEMIGFVRVWYDLVIFVTFMMSCEFMSVKG